MTEKKKYDSTVARVAGNILSGILQVPQKTWTSELMSEAVMQSVKLARLIIAETERTESVQPISASSER